MPRPYLWLLDPVIVRDDPKLRDDSGEIPKPNRVVGGSIPGREIDSQWCSLGMGEQNLMTLYISASFNSGQSTWTIGGCYGQLDRCLEYAKKCLHPCHHISLLTLFERACCWRKGTPSSRPLIVTTRPWWWSKMTLNYSMIVERHPNGTEWLAVWFPAVKSSLYLTENQPDGQAPLVFE